MPTKVKVGQWWQSPHIHQAVFEIMRIDDKKVVWARQLDPISGLVVREDLLFGQLLLNDYPDGWDVSWICIKEVADLPHLSSRIERPCRNKWCQRMNDLGAKICWHCETENPTKG